MQIGILKLPETVTIKSDDYFIINVTENELPVTKKILFSSMQFGLENTTFAPTITSHSTEIQYLSSSLDSLSGQTTLINSLLQNYIKTKIQQSFLDLVDVIFPIGSIIHTATDMNPSTYIPNTYWALSGQGLFLASVTNDQQPHYDKNNVAITIYPGDGGNFSLGEYSKALVTSQMPAHTHTASMFGETNASNPGLYVESAQGPGSVLTAIESTSAGNSDYHNNIPPLYGVYIWQRVATNQGIQANTVSNADIVIITPAPTPTPIARDTTYDGNKKDPTDKYDSTSYSTYEEYLLKFKIDRGGLIPGQDIFL